MTEKKKHTRTISQIERGTVIDHLNPNVVFQIVRILDIDDDTEEQVTVGTNLFSKHMGRKGIIKIGNRFLDQDTINKIAIISPNATVSNIDNYEVVQKFNVEIPEEVVSVITCPNPNCVTNSEGVATRFRLVERDPILMLCTYCERYIRENEIEIT
ncbi:MAG TPA: aspartate carbamoyltransferase regulatory subunit [bacterium]|jgi:aspartate carbamoyltransferase regulatory subunit